MIIIEVLKSKLLISDLVQGKLLYLMLLFLLLLSLENEMYIHVYYNNNNMIEIDFFLITYIYSILFNLITSLYNHRKYCVCSRFVGVTPLTTKCGTLYSTG